MVTMFQQLFASVWNERKIMVTWTESTLDKKGHTIHALLTHTHTHTHTHFNMDHLHMDLFNLPNAHPPIL
jgi:hypothetical protein